MATTLQEAIAFAELRTNKVSARDGSTMPIEAAKMISRKMHGKNCKCEACSSLHMKRTERGSKKKMTQPVKAEDFGLPKKKNKMVAPPKSSAKKLNPSNLMHDKGMLMPNKNGRARG